MPSPEKFNETLKEYSIDEQTVKLINDGYEGLVSKASKPQKAAYFKRAVDIMEERLEFPVMRELLEANGCCKTGAREKASKAFAKENAALSLDERLPKIKDVPYMGNPVRNDDGSITVHAVYYGDGERYMCACPNYNKVKRDYSVSKSYCFCCAGHFRHHYEIMLGAKLVTEEIVSSPLDSDGKNPCIIRFSVVKAVNV